MIIILERFNKKLDIIIEAQARTNKKLQEEREISPPLSQLKAEWKAKYVSQY